MATVADLVFRHRRLFIVRYRAVSYRRLPRRLFDLPENDEMADRFCRRIIRAVRHPRLLSERMYLAPQTSLA